MKTEGVSTHLLDAFTSLIGYQTSGTPTGSLETEQAGRTPGMARRPSVPLQKVHWSAIPADRLDRTLWASDQSSRPGVAEEIFFADRDIAQLEQLFGAAAVVSRPAGSGREGADNNNREKETGRSVIDPSRLFVLDAKRAQNITIGLTQFKGVQGGATAVARAILNLHTLDGLLDCDKLSNFAVG
jgi:hypothetical protein